MPATEPKPIKVITYTLTIEDETEPIKVTYTLTIEDETDVTPEESLCSDEPELDAAECERIHARLARGDTWAWCFVIVIAEVKIDGETFRGRASLGGCSYRDEADFLEPGGYFDDLCDEAWHALIASAVAACNRGDVATRARPALEASRPVRREVLAPETLHALDVAREGQNSD